MQREVDGWTNFKGFRRVLKCEGIWMGKMEGLRRVLRGEGIWMGKMEGLRQRGWMDGELEKT